MEKEILDCGKLLIDKKLTLALAESATAGYVSAKFSVVPDAGKFLKGGLVCYDAELKKSLLQVSEELIETFTPESMEVTSAITHGLVSLIPADLHLGITGLTCPGGSETPEKPVGTMFVCALLHGKKLFTDRTVLSGTEEEIMYKTGIRVAELLLTALT